MALLKSDLRMASFIPNFIERIIPYAKLWYLSFPIYFIGDIKRISSDAKVVVYLYYDARTRHTTYGDGVEIYEFPNGQVERHFPDGRKEIDFPDKTRKFIHNNGDQESIFSDGVIVREYASGKKEIITPEGHIEPETFLV